MARFGWLFLKKRGARSTGSKTAGRLGEAAFFLSLFLLGVAGLILLAWSWATSGWPVAALLRQTPFPWGLWLMVLLLAALAAAGSYGVISGALAVRTSAERRAALAQAAKVALEDAEDLLPPERDFPTVPRDTNLLNSPGVKLKYRLPATQEPAWRLFGSAVWTLTCGALAAALGVVTIEQHLTGQPRWFLTGFAALVCVLAAWATYSFLRELVSAGWIGPTSVEISQLPLLPGGTCELYLNQPGTLSVRRLEVLLVCDEETIYLQGTDIRQDRQRVFRQVVCARERFEIDAAQPLEENCTIHIPPQAMHSYKSPFNAVNWKLIVEIQAEGWPLYRRSFPLIVYPRAVPAPQRAAS